MAGLRGGIDEVFVQIGQFGRYQAAIYFFISFVWVLGGMGALLANFIQAEPAVQCIASENGGCSMTEPLTMKEACHLPRDEWSYVEPSRTVAAEWDLVCENGWKPAMSTSAFFIGHMIGTGFLGVRADKKGRKDAFLIGVLGAGVAGLSVSAATGYWSYTLLRAATGFFIGGASIAGYVLSMEFVGPRYRSICGVAESGLFALGFMAVSIIAAFVPNWRVLNALVFLPFFGYLILHKKISESPRWYFAVGERAKTVDMLQSIADINGSDVVVDDILLDEERTPQKKGVSVLLTHPQLRVRTLVTAFCWFAFSIGYYGLSLNAGNMGANIYVSSCLSALIELPSYVVMIYLMDVLGRKSTTMYATGIAGICSILASVSLTIGGGPVFTMATSLLGKGAIAGSFAVAYVYCSELYPTSVRSAAVGVASQCARIGSILAPTFLATGAIWEGAPLLAFGSFALVAAVLTVLLPETLGVSSLEVESLMALHERVDVESLVLAENEKSPLVGVGEPQHFNYDTILQVSTVSDSGSPQVLVTPAEVFRSP